MIETALLVASLGALTGSLGPLVIRALKGYLHLGHRTRRKVSIEIDGSELEIDDIHDLKTEEVDRMIRLLNSARDSAGGEVKGAS